MHRANEMTHLRIETGSTFNIWHGFLSVACLMLGLGLVLLFLDIHEVRREMFEMRQRQPINLNLHGAQYPAIRFFGDGYDVALRERE